MFSPVDQQPDLPALEQRVLERWREGDVFRRSLEAREGAPVYRFYEGPPTANNRPGVHHVEARVFKDLFPRYRTMKGFAVPRKAGWDCHGIPVEVEVEKRLGFTRKQDIEDYGVERFNALCRQSVRDYVADWNRLTERVGFWVDLDDPYWTMTPAYVESVWWSLQQLWDGGFLYEGHKVVPYCARCGTALSDHEVSQGYAKTVDPSVFVRFPVLEGPLASDGASLLIWTTTPWTLVSNTAVAVADDIRYVLVRAAGDDHPVVMAAELLETVLGEGATVLRDVAVDELLGVHYRGPFDLVAPDDGADWRYVVLADFVTTTDGTGLVHMAPAFGEEDMQVAEREGLPIVNPVDLEGRFESAVEPFAGLFVKDADAAIIDDLRARGLLLRASTYEHTYPFCWRCRTPLLYYATPSWYIATTRVRDRLLELNAGIDWFPETIRTGRFGNWLENNVDWALSRSRYWGTPLPLWRCDGCDEVTCVGSRAELGDLAARDLSDLDPHRPYVDDVTFACASCGGTARRVPGVIDAWYDSGCMPFAQHGYPHAEGSEELFGERFPADFICEAIDQTRGWFYSLLAISTLLFDRSSYDTVLCLGHIVDADGRKMSKSVGNIIDPWEIVDRHGADALRWLLLTEGSPWVNRRVGHGPVEEVVRRFLLTLWNSYYFFVTYARLESWTPASSAAAPVVERATMDRWVLAELSEVVRGVDAALDAYDATLAGRLLSGFVDDLSNWYIRRTRGRFWRSGGGADQDAAFATLHECLVTATALLAPFVPFVAEELYTNLVRSVDGSAPDSVHLLDFPRPDSDADDPRLRDAMAAARRVVELGRRARNEARIGVRQPLPRAIVTVPAADATGWDAVADVVAEELNVKVVELAEGAATSVTYRLKPSFRELGRSFGRRTPAVAAAIEAADAEAGARALRHRGELSVDVDGEVVRVEAAMVQVLEDAREGWQVATDGPTAVALDLEITDELRHEGLARELVRAVNDLRKQRGLELDDRIMLELTVDEVLAPVLHAHGEDLAREVLATTVRTGAAEGGEVLRISGHEVRVAFEVVGR